MYEVNNDNKRECAWCNECNIVQESYNKGRVDAIDGFQEWLKNQIVGLDNKTKEILVVREDRWELAIDEYKEQLKEQKK